jgi:hypothetical protein
MIFHIWAYFLLCKKPGFPLQFLVPPMAVLRDFRFNPLRGSTSGLPAVNVVQKHKRTLLVQPAH